MIFQEKKGLKWLEFESLRHAGNLKHGVLTRRGGFSKTPFNSLNLNLAPSGNTSDIVQNLSKVKEAFGLKKMIWSKQVHKTTLIEVNSKNASDTFECDGFLTNEKGIALLIKHADCQAALFYDPVKKVIGNVHAGWRGNVLNIYQKMIEKMTSLYASNPKDIYVCISPSLGPKSAEFKHYKEEFPKHFWPFQTKENHFDLWSIAKTPTPRTRDFRRPY